MADCYSWNIDLAKFSWNNFVIMKLGQSVSFFLIVNNAIWWITESERAIEPWVHTPMVNNTMYHCEMSDIIYNAALELGNHGHTLKRYAVK